MESNQVQNIYRELGSEYFQKYQAANSIYKDTISSDLQVLLALSAIKNLIPGGKYIVKAVESASEDIYDIAHITRKAEGVSRGLPGIDDMNSPDDVYNTINDFNSMISQVNDVLEDLILFMQKKYPEDFDNLNPTDARNPEIYDGYTEQFDQYIYHKKETAKSRVKSEYNRDNLEGMEVLQDEPIITNIVGITCGNINPGLLLNPQRMVGRASQEVENLARQKANEYAQILIANDFDIAELLEKFTGDVISTVESTSEQLLTLPEQLLIRVTKTVKGVVEDLREEVSSLFMQFEELSRTLLKLGATLIGLPKASKTKFEEWWDKNYTKDV